MSTRYQSYLNTQHHQAQTAPTVAIVPSANHVRLRRRGRRHHLKEMDQGDRLLD